MNEALAVYLNLDMENIEKIEEIIRKIDELLLTVGMKYSGIMNLYISVDEQKRDETVFRAEELLRNTDWLKDILSHILIGVITNACPIEEIQTDMMSNPSSEKWVYYEQYYQKTKQLPHAIVVDENKQLRDGYISYLLAKKYGVQAEVCGMVLGQPLRKIVKGRHVVLSNGKWKKKSNKRYIWIYTLKKPVVPGDILLVNTKKGRAYICVDRIEYAAGQGFCSRYNTVKKHMNMRMEEGEYTNDGK